MKNEPTELEIFQGQRIEALENELQRVNDMLTQAQNDLRVVAVKSEAAAKRILVSDPVFLKPLSDVEKNYEILDASHIEVIDEQIL